MAKMVFALNLVVIVCALYVTWRAYQDSFKWGLFFFLSPVAYYALIRYTGAVIAGVIIIGLQLYYVRNNWKAVGKPFTVLVIAWLAAQFLPALLARP